VWVAVTVTVGPGVPGAAIGAGAVRETVTVEPGAGRGVLVVVAVVVTVVPPGPGAVCVVVTTARGSATGAEGPTVVVLVLDRLARDGAGDRPSAEVPPDTSTATCQQAHAASTTSNASTPKEATSIPRGVFQLCRAVTW
jgi:hypothetical protein